MVALILDGQAGRLTASPPPRPLTPLTDATPMTSLAPTRLALSVATALWLPPCPCRGAHRAAGASIQAAVQQAQPATPSASSLDLPRDGFHRQGEPHAAGRGGRRQMGGAGRRRQAQRRHPGLGPWVTIQKFWVKDYKGNGIMTQGANNYRILDNVVDGGFYGIFPQFARTGCRTQPGVAGGGRRQSMSACRTTPTSSPTRPGAT